MAVGRNRAIHIRRHSPDGRQLPFWRVPYRKGLTARPKGRPYIVSGGLDVFDTRLQAQLAVLTRAKFRDVRHQEIEKCTWHDRVVRMRDHLRDLAVVPADLVGFSGRDDLGIPGPAVTELAVPQRVEFLYDLRKDNITRHAKSFNAKQYLIHLADVCRV